MAGDGGMAGWDGDGGEGSSGGRAGGGDTVSAIVRRVPGRQPPEGHAVLLNVMEFWDCRLTSDVTVSRVSLYVVASSPQGLHATRGMQARKRSGVNSIMMRRPRLARRFESQLNGSWPQHCCFLSPSLRCKAVQSSLQLIYNK